MHGKIKRSFNSDIRDFFDKKQDIKKITQSNNLKNILLCYILFLIVNFVLFINDTEVCANHIVSIFSRSIVTFLLYLLALTFVKSSILGRCPWLISIIVTSFFVNTLFFIYLEITIIVLFILIFMSIIILFDDMLQRKKTNLANAYEIIKGLKKYINDYSNINEYDIYNIYLWDKYYVYAVLMNIKKI